jgi:ATP:ADP antiporter, AAA family
MLPVVYLLSILATGLVVLLHARIKARRTIESMIAYSLGFFALTGLALHAALLAGVTAASGVINYVYWVWASVLIIVLITGFWTAVNEIYNPRQARRLIFFLNSGGILGSVVGGLLVALLADGPGGAWLLPGACLSLAAGIPVVLAIFRTHRTWGRGAVEDRTERPAGTAAGILASVRAVNKDRFLALLAATVALGIIVSTCIEFQFLSSSYLHFRFDSQRLQAFFGVFEAGLTSFAFLLNGLMAGFILRKLAAVRALLLTPLLLLAGSAALLVLPFGLIWGVFIRGLDEGLTYSVSHPFREILYIPVPAHLRHDAKVFIEMFVGQCAKLAGAAVLLVFAVALRRAVQGGTPMFDPTVARWLSLVVIALLVPWIAYARRLGKAYLAAVKENIQPLWDRGVDVLRGKVDVEYAKLVFDTIDSRNYSTALYALHLFDLLALGKLGPELKTAIAVKSEEIQAKALSDRLETGAAALVPEALDEMPLDMLAAEIPIVLSSRTYQDVMRSYVEKLLERGPDAEVEKMELAKAIGLMEPGAPLAAFLPRLVGDDSPAVASFALRSAGRLKRTEDLPSIVHRLRRVGTLQDSLNALEAYGDAAVGALEAGLRDPAEELLVRSAVVEALERIGTRRAVRILAEELQYGSGELDHRLIDALEDLQSRKVPVPLSAAAARRKTRGLVKKLCRDFLDLHREGQEPDDLRLRHLLARNLESTFADIFKLLGFIYPPKDVQRAYQNIRSGRAHAVAHAVEWLDNALSRDLHDLLMPIVDDLSVAQKIAAFRKILEELGDL